MVEIGCEYPCSLIRGFAVVPRFEDSAVVIGVSINEYRKVMVDREFGKPLDFFDRQFERRDANSSNR